MKFVAILAALPVAASVTCPDSSASIYCGGTIAASVGSSCAATKTEVLARIANANGWVDSHNRGTYTLLNDSADKIEFKRVTGDGKC